MIAMLEKYNYFLHLAKRVNATWPPGIEREICYFSGHLAESRLKYDNASHTWEPVAEVEMLAAAFYDAALRGDVVLYQRKQAKGYDYMARAIR